MGIPHEEHTLRFVSWKKRASKKTGTWGVPIKIPGENFKFAFTSSSQRDVFDTSKMDFNCKKTGRDEDPRGRPKKRVRGEMGQLFGRVLMGSLYETVKFKQHNGQRKNFIKSILLNGNLYFVRSFRIKYLTLLHKKEASKKTGTFQIAC